jgi:hypothetical protein
VLDDEEARSRFRSEARRRRFDLAIQLHGDGSVSKAIVAQLGAPAMAGYAPNSPGA